MTVTGDPLPTGDERMTQGGVIGGSTLGAGPIGAGFLSKLIPEELTGAGTCQAVFTVQAVGITGAGTVETGPVASLLAEVLTGAGVMQAGEKGLPRTLWGSGTLSAPTAQSWAVASTLTGSGTTACANEPTQAVSEETVGSGLMEAPSSPVEARSLVGAGTVLAVPQVISRGILGAGFIYGGDPLGLVPLDVFGEGTTYTTWYLEGRTLEGAGTLAA